MKTLSLAFALLASCAVLRAQDFVAAPPELQTAMFVRLLGFNQSLGAEASLYVLGSEPMLTEFRKVRGQRLGSSSELKVVEGGGALPEQRFDILYVGDPAQLEAARAYAEQHRCVSIGGHADFRPGSVSLAVLVATADSKPRVLLSPRRSRVEAIEWNPAVLRIGSAEN